MNPYLVVILAALAAAWALEAVADWLNLRRAGEALPAEFAGCYDAARYARAQRYLRDTTRFGLLRDSAATAALVAFIAAGGFNLADRAARSLNFGELATGLAFGALLVLGSRLLALPFAVYDTFVLEARYGFNTTTPGTFALDLLKELLLTALLGAPLFAAVLWLFDRAGPLAWLCVWGFVAAFELVVLYVAPYVIMPLFNRFAPLPAGELRAAVEAYAAAETFRMKGVFQMDGSRRSSKTNAFFTGFGRSRRIVLYDTLIARHTVPELVAVVAHEMGHYRRRHVPKALARSIALSGVTFFLLSRFIRHPGLFAAFGMEHLSIYASLVFFAFLYTPISLAVSLVEHAISRRQEYEADAYAAATGGSPLALIDALKKLSVENLSNLTPHPLKVLLDYGHPPVLERIRAIRALVAAGEGRSR